MSLQGVPLYRVDTVSHEFKWFRFRLTTLLDESNISRDLQLPWVEFATLSVKFTALSSEIQLSHLQLSRVKFSCSSQIFPSSWVKKWQLECYFIAWIQYNMRLTRIYNFQRGESELWRNDSRHMVVLELLNLDLITWWMIVFMWFKTFKKYIFY